MENSTKQQLLRNDFFLRSIYSKYLIASVLAMLATSVAGMIDTVIVGRFLGETGLAAMSLVSPVYLIYYTIGAVIGMGGSIAANLAIGRNDYAAYRRIFTLAFWTTAVLCVVTTAGGLLFLDPPDETITPPIGGFSLWPSGQRQSCAWLQRRAACCFWILL